MGSYYKFRHNTIYVYRLTFMSLKAFVSRNQINEAPFISVKAMIYLKLTLLIATKKLISFRDVIANLASVTLTLV